MKSINTNRGSTYTLAPNGSFDTCAKDSKRLKLVEEQLSQLQEDFGLLNKEVEGFGSSFNTASAHITKLEANNASVKETLTAKKVASEILQTKKLVKNFEEKTASGNCIIGLASDKEADLDIIVIKDSLPQYVKLHVNGDTVISQGSGANHITDLRIYDNGTVEALFLGNANVLVYSESKNFTAFSGSRSTSYKTIPVNNEITLSGKINFDNGQSIAFNNIDAKSLTVEEYALLGQTHIKLNEAPVEVKSCARIAWDTGLASYNDGSIKICYQDGKLVYAIMPNNAKIIREGANDYIVYTGTLTSDYIISPGSVPAFVETPIPVGYTTLCENGTFLDELTTDVLKANTVETDRANIASGEINVLATDRANINDLNSTDLNTVTATVQGLFSVGQVKLTKKISLPEILPTEITDVVFDLHSGMIVGSIVDSDKKVIASFTAVKNTADDSLKGAHSNFIISYAQSKLGNLHTFKELEDGRFVVSTRLSGKELYYGFISTEEEMPVETIVDNLAPVTLEHANVKLQHSVILGNHKSDYGLAVDGEVKADLLPLPGIQAFVDVDISNSLHVGGHTELNTVDIKDTLVAAKNLEAGEDLKVGRDATIGGTTAIGGNTSIGTVDAPADLTVTGNIYQKGDAYETHVQQLKTTKDWIITRQPDDPAKPTPPLAPGDMTGIKAVAYDDEGNNGILGFDKTGTARVGDEGKEQAIATRAEEAEMVNGNIVAWNGTDKKLVTPKAAIVDGHTLAKTDDALMLYGSEGMDNIPEGSLDTVVKCGQYSADDGLANKITEKPTAETGAFDLIVGYFNTDSTLPYQIYTSKGKQKAYYRMTVDGMYGEWKQLASKAQVDSLIKSAVDAEAKARADADTAIINGTTPVQKVANNANTWTLDGGKAIPNGTDFNTIQIPGTYYSALSSNSFPNLPPNVEAAGVLLVYSGSGTAYPTQEYKPLASPYSFKRVFLGSGWSQWSHSLTNENGWDFYGGSELPAKVDMKTIITPGTYFSSTNDGNYSPIDCPKGTRGSGTLIVYKSAGTRKSCFTQEWFDNGNPNKIARRLTENDGQTWTDWKVFKSSDSTWDFYGGTQLPSKVDMKTIITPGTYCNIMDRPENNPIDVPSGMKGAGVLKVYISLGGIAPNSYITQEWTDYRNPNNIARRLTENRGKTWTDWQIFEGVGLNDKMATQNWVQDEATAFGAKYLVDIGSLNSTFTPNEAIEDGVYCRWGGNGTANMPYELDSAGILMTKAVRSNKDFIAQIYFDLSSRAMFSRSKYTGKWQDWLMLSLQPKVWETYIEVSNKGNSYFGAYSIAPEDGLYIIDTWVTGSISPESSPHSFQLLINGEEKCRTEYSARGANAFGSISFVDNIRKGSRISSRIYIYSSGGSGTTGIHFKLTKIGVMTSVGGLSGGVEL